MPRTPPHRPVSVNHQAKGQRDWPQSGMSTALCHTHSLTHSLTVALCPLARVPIHANEERGERGSSKPHRLGPFKILYFTVRRLGKLHQKGSTFLVSREKWRKLKEKSQRDRAVARMRVRFLHRPRESAASSSVASPVAKS